MRSSFQIVAITVFATALPSLAAPVTGPLDAVRRDINSLNAGLHLPCDLLNAPGCIGQPPESSAVTSPIASPVVTPVFKAADRRQLRPIVPHIPCVIEPNAPACRGRVSTHAIVRPTSTQVSSDAIPSGTPASAPVLNTQTPESIVTAPVSSAPSVQSPSLGSSVPSPIASPAVTPVFKAADRRELGPIGPHLPCVVVPNAPACRGKVSSRPIAKPTPTQVSSDAIPSGTPTSAPVSPALNTPTASPAPESIVPVPVPSAPSVQSPSLESSLPTQTPVRFDGVVGTPDIIQ